FTLRRIIQKGDRLVGDTTRAIKQEKEFARPDKGERVKIRVALDVEKISIDDVVDRLRVQGTIAESDSESVSKGSHHSMTLMKEGDQIIMFGPGETKRRLGNFLTQLSSYKERKIQAIDGIDSAGEDGIYTFVKSEIMKQTLAKSKLAKVSSILDEIMHRVN